MRKIIAGMQISLDAKIEGPEGHADWVSEEDWGGTYGLPTEVDTCILGHRMYPGYEAYWNAVASHPSRPLELTGRLPTSQEIEYAAFAVSTPHFVLSHSPGESL